MNLIEFFLKKALSHPFWATLLLLSVLALLYFGREMELSLITENWKPYAWCLAVPLGFYLLLSLICFLWKKRKEVASAESSIETFMGLSPVAKEVFLNARKTMNGYLITFSRADYSLETEIINSGLVERYVPSESLSDRSFIVVESFSCFIKYHQLHVHTKQTRKHR